MPGWSGLDAVRLPGVADQETRRLRLPPLGTADQAARDAIAAIYLDPRTWQHRPFPKDM
jgi:hypothetical protein